MTHIDGNRVASWLFWEFFHTRWKILFLCGGKHARWDWTNMRWDWNEGGQIGEQGQWGPDWGAEGVVVRLGGQGEQGVILGVISKYPPCTVWHETTLMSHQREILHSLIFTLSVDLFEGFSAKQSRLKVCENQSVPHVRHPQCQWRFHGGSNPHRQGSHSVFTQHQDNDLPEHYGHLEGVTQENFSYVSFASKT